MLTHFFTFVNFIDTVSGSRFKSRTCRIAHSMRFQVNPDPKIAQDSSFWLISAEIHTTSETIDMVVSMWVLNPLILKWPPCQNFLIHDAPYREKINSHTTINHIFRFVFSSIIYFFLYFYIHRSLPVLVLPIFNQHIAHELKWFAKWHSICFCYIHMNMYTL